MFRILEMLKLLTVGAVLLTTFKAQAERNMPIILVNDDRRQILIMEFGFAPRGWFNLTIENAKIEVPLASVKAQTDSCLHSS